MGVAKIPPGTINKINKKYDWINHISRNSQNKRQRGPSFSAKMPWETGSLYGYNINDI